ncbi:hypothetical protein PWG15_02275 [Ensifer adhaerens]|uniref:hypothetical protein n=1 Tax=Ensifer adhaerens TaxID=106592 RepID=UPI0023A9B01D|nr:hypothetical protein [Ensifer adhaerens]WDZ79033.1 hypothetical protein PWG15_02275 [Ensifer adhaerens]
MTKPACSGAFQGTGNDIVERPVDPALPLKHLTLKNRIISTAYEPAYSEDGMPMDRYRLV